MHRTQVSHLPDAVDPTPIEQGISVYFTELDWGGVSYAILSDRMFKSSPSVMVPEGQFKNGWPQAEGFDPATQSDVAGAELLGQRQETFLKAGQLTGTRTTGRRRCCPRRCSATWRRCRRAQTPVVPFRVCQFPCKASTRRVTDCGGWRLQRLAADGTKSCTSCHASRGGNSCLWRSASWFDSSVWNRQLWRCWLGFLCAGDLEHMASSMVSTSAWGQ